MTGLFFLMKILLALKKQSVEAHNSNSDILTPMPGAGTTKDENIDLAIKE
jgi:hypothetical protein